jgi:hypothetical protein
MPCGSSGKGIIMVSKKISRFFGMMMAMAIVPTALAAEPIKLDCPAGAKQKAKGDIVACMKADSVSKRLRPHGPTVYLYPSGAKQAEGMSEEGFRTGLWTLYDEQGRKTGTAMFKGSNFHGEVVELYPNGKVRKVEHYAEGLRHGTAKEFSEDGKLVKQTEYRNNREVASK